MRRGSYPVVIPPSLIVHRGFELSEIPGVRRGKATWDAAHAIDRIMGSELYAACPWLKPDTRVLNQAFVDLQPNLRPYQDEGARWLARRDWAMLCDPMRSGKTRTTLAAAKLRGARSILIVGPAISRRVWAREIERFLGERSLMLYGRAASQARWFGERRYKFDESAAVTLFDEASIVIVNYDLLISHTSADGRGKILKPEHLPGWARTLKERKFDCVILDESHLCSGFGGVRGEENRRSTCAAMLEHVPCVWALTGTPIRGGRLRALWGQLDLVSKGLYGGPKPFGFDVRYADGRHTEVQIGPEETRRVWKADGRSNVDELRARLEIIALRRPRSLILPFLPAKTRDLRIVEADGIEVSGDPSQYESASARQQAKTAKAKIPELIKEVKEECEQGAKIVVYCNLRETLELLATSIRYALESNHGKQMRIKDTKLWVCSGDVSAESRGAMAEKFCDHPGSAIWIATIKSVPGSLSLYSRDERYPTSTIHFLEPDWDPIAMQQAEDRPYEMGSKGLAIVYWALEGSYDDHALSILVPKLETLDAVEGGDAGSVLSTIQKNIVKETRQQIIERITSAIRFEEE